MEGHQVKFGKCSSKSRQSVSSKSSKSRQFLRTRGRSNSTAQLVEEQDYCAENGVGNSKRVECLGGSGGKQCRQVAIVYM